MGNWFRRKQKLFFFHPKNQNLKVFVFADTPHLLKLIRNHYFDSGFNIPVVNTTTTCIDQNCKLKHESRHHVYNEHLSKSVLQEMCDLDSSDLKVAFKLKRDYLEVRGSERQRVNPAAKVFSNSTALAMEHFALQGFLKYEKINETVEKIKLINAWFDILNSKCQYYPKSPSKNAYGTDTVNQDKVLNKMSSFIKTMRVGDRTKLLPFQQGILVNNKAIKQLLPYLKDTYSTGSFQIDHILTYRINQDVVENFFGYIRGMGGQHTRPSALQFKYRLRWYLLGKHCQDLFICNNNAEEDDDESFVVAEPDTENANKETLLKNDFEAMKEVRLDELDDQELTINPREEIDVNPDVCMHSNFSNKSKPVPREVNLNDYNLEAQDLGSVILHDDSAAIDNILCENKDVSEWEEQQENDYDFHEVINQDFADDFFMGDYCNKYL